MSNYIDPHFNINEFLEYNNTEYLKEISNYLDFALNTTIQKIYPNKTEEEYKELAKKTFIDYLIQNNNFAFTRQFNIRSNILAIDAKKIIFLLIKSMLISYVYNKDVCHLLNNTTYLEECADYITDIVYQGRLDQIDYWIVENLSVLIENYIDMVYLRDNQTKSSYEYLIQKNPKTKRALEQLNLEMHLEQINNRA